MSILSITSAARAGRFKMNMRIGCAEITIGHPELTNTVGRSIDSWRKLFIALSEPTLCGTWYVLVAKSSGRYIT